MKNLFLAFTFLFCSNAFASELIKFGAMGIPNHEMIVRQVTNGKSVTLQRPGAKGLIAFKALENKEFDFLIIGHGALITGPAKDPNFLGFDPKEKFRVIGVVAESKVGAVISPKFKNIEELRSKKDSILHASSGDESELIIGNLFPNNTITHVNYSSVGKQFIDVSSGLADIYFSAEVQLRALSPDVIPINQTFKIYIVTRKDVNESEIKELIKLINNNIQTESSKEFQKSRMVIFNKLKL